MLFVLQELRTPELLVQVTRDNTALSRRMLPLRPLLALAMAGDRVGLGAHLRAEKLDLGECLYAAAEREQEGAIDALLELQYAADGDGEPKGAWLAERRRELEQWLAGRG